MNHRKYLLLYSANYYNNFIAMIWRSKNQYRKISHEIKDKKDVNKNHGYKNIMNETNHAYKIT